MNKLIMLLTLLSMMSCGHDSREIKVNKNKNKNFVANEQKKNETAAKAPEKKVADLPKLPILQGEVKSQGTAENKETGKIETKTETKTEVKTDVKSEVKVETKVDPKVTTPVVKIPRKEVEVERPQGSKGTSKSDVTLDDLQETAGESVKCSLSFSQNTKENNEEIEVSTGKSLCLGFDAKGVAVNRASIEEDKTVYKLTEKNKILAIDLLSIEIIEDEDDYSHARVDYKILSSADGVEELNVSSLSLLDFTNPPVFIPINDKANIKWTS